MSYFNSIAINGNSMMLPDLQEQKEPEIQQKKPTSIYKFSNKEI